VTSGVDPAAHWETVYTEKSVEQRSWSEPTAAESMRLIQHSGVGRDRAILDVGGGASVLVRELRSAGYRDLTVIDISSAALAESAETDHQGGDGEPAVERIVADVRRWKPPRTFALWHDRAVFHFMVGDDDLAGYLRALYAGTGPGSHLVLATFSHSGPESCSGLPVRRWDSDQLAELLRGTFVPVEAASLVHLTPWGSEQPFTWTLFVRR